jgi:anti-anti-sigma factor
MLTQPEPMARTAAGGLLQVVTRVKGEACLIEVAGELDRSTVAILESHLARAELSSRGRVLVDLGRVAFLDSAGLRALLRAADGDGIRVLAPSRAVMRILELTGTGDHLPRA